MVISVETTSGEKVDVDLVSNTVCARGKTLKVVRRSLAGVVCTVVDEQDPQLKGATHCITVEMDDGKLERIGLSDDSAGLIKNGYSLLKEAKRDSLAKGKYKVAVLYLKAEEYTRSENEKMVSAGFEAISVLERAKNPEDVTDSVAQILDNWMEF